MQKRKRALTLAFAVCLIVLICPVSSLAQSANLVLGTGFFAPTDAPMPAKGATFTDPNFHTSMVRITDKSEYTDPGIENEYAKSDPENCDGTLVILRGNAGEWYLYDARTFEQRKHFGSDFVYMVEPEPRWSTSDSKTLYYIWGTELRTYNVDTDASALVHDFKVDYPGAAFITTSTEGSPSLDLRYWPYLVEDADYNVIAGVVYDKQTNTVIAHRETFPEKPEDISMDVSGRHVVFGFDSHQFQVCPRDLSSVKDFPEGANGHNDFALTADGRDVSVYQNIRNDYICMFDLDVAVETRLLAIPFDVNIDIGLHISGNCADTPGWVLVSTYGSKQAPADQTHSWMDTQLFMLQLKENPVIYRICHTHAYTSDEVTGDKNYFAEAFAAINRAGSRIYFGSNWANLTPDYSDTYQVTLPQGWQYLAAGYTPSAVTFTPAPLGTPTNPPPTATPTIQEGTLLPVTFIVVPIVALATAVVVAVMFVRRRGRKLPHPP